MGVSAFKCLAVSGSFLLVACSTTSAVDDNQPVERCESTDCFNQLQIRDFEIVDEQTLIVYVGQQECAFLVELTGTFCDITFLPGFEVVFRPTRQRQAREPVIGGGVAGRADISNARVCANDLDMGIAEGPFTTVAAGEDSNFDGLDCRIRNVSSLTDDEVLEIYVDNRFAPPPPPFGTGEISVEETPEDAGEPEAAGSAAGQAEADEAGAEATPQR